jgi:hypothetical protein
VKSTGSYHTYQSDTLGEIKLAGGKHRLEVRVTSLPHESVMNLHEIRLTPAR